MGSVFLGIALLALAGGMIAWHRDNWQRRAGRAPHGDDRFARRQLRRRLRASGLMGVLGLFLLLGPLVSNPYLQVVYWCGAMLVVAWVVVLALADLMQTREHFGELRTKNLTQQAAMEAEVQRLRRSQTNDHDDQIDKGSG